MRVVKKHEKSSAGSIEEPSQRIRDLRLVAFRSHSIARSYRFLHCANGMQHIVGDDAYAGRAGAERDEPDPVTPSHQVVRAQPPGTCEGTKDTPIGAAHPVVDSDLIRHAERRVGVVIGRPGQAQAAFGGSRDRMRSPAAAGGRVRCSAARRAPV